MALLNLLCGAEDGSRWADAEKASLLVVKEAAEDGWRVKVGPGHVSLRRRCLDLRGLHLPAHEVDRAIHAYQGASVHVSDHSVVLNGQVVGLVRAALGMSGSALVTHCDCCVWCTKEAFLDELT